VTYSADFRYVFDASNPDSLFDDTAWLASIYDGVDIVCDVSNNGITGTHIHAYDDGLLAKLGKSGEEMFADSIDPLHDMIDHLLYPLRNTDA
jgi:hypothetical protein